MARSWEEAAAEVLVPSQREVWISAFAALLVVCLYHFFSAVSKLPKGSEIEERARVERSPIRQQRGEAASPGAPDPGGQSLAEIAKAVVKHPANRVGHSAVEEGLSRRSSGYAEDLLDGVSNAPLHHIKFELLSARNLVAANLNGTSDPYAVLVCREQRRFSSVIPGNRNPMWGETFDFIVEELPATIMVEVYDWDIIWKSTALGCATVEVVEPGLREPEWHSLDRYSGQVQVQITTTPVSASMQGKDTAPLNGWRRRRSSAHQAMQQVATEVRQKPGPLQTIFGLPPDEVVLHTFSCAMERSFLYHGRMYVSRFHICFHSNIFSKGLKVTLPFDDVEELKRSQHAFINPAITILMREGSGGHGVPPLASPDGRAKYKFASFWNRNHAYRVLGRVRQAFLDEEAAFAAQKAVTMSRSASLERTTSFLITTPEPRRSLEHAVTIPRKQDGPPALPVKPFLHDSGLSPLLEAELPITAREFFELFYADESLFTQLFRDSRKDTQLAIENWHRTEEFGGLIRKITFRALCTSPMCPPDSAMTDWQHVTYQEVEKLLLLESVTQAHDVPFGSYFEVENRWRVQTTGPASCSISVLTGVNFKKWCVMQGKIKNGATQECKADWTAWLELAKQEVRRLKEEADARKEEERRNGLRRTSVQDEMLALAEPIAVA